MFNICLDDSRALERQGVSRFMMYKMPVYDVQNASLWCTKCQFMMYKMPVYDVVDLFLTKYHF